MTRYALTLEYDGRGFVGWQRQANGPSVQQAVETAIRAFCGETVAIVGAGRTDTGVHALAQVAHVDLGQAHSAKTVRDAVNFHLRPVPVVIVSAVEVAPSFHARFSAIGRSYRYRILNRRPPPALDAGRVWWVPVPLDAAAMHDAAHELIGRHDFTTFRASLCQAASPVRTLDRLDVDRDGDEVIIVAEARSFLHRQVRNMTGAMKLVGEGKWTADDLAAALAACDRTRGGPTAPAAGLYLTGVRYPDPLQ